MSVRRPQPYVEAVLIVTPKGLQWRKRVVAMTWASHLKVQAQVRATSIAWKAMMARKLFRP